MAFETSGRYGFTAVFNKIFLRENNLAYFVAMPFPFVLAMLSLLQLVHLSSLELVSKKSPGRNQDRS